MRIKSIIGATIIIVFIVLVAWKDAGAVFNFSDCFSMTGFVRYEFGIHTGQSNPNFPPGDNHKLSLSRFSLQTEWTYQPTDSFRAFAIIRATGDTTSLWDDKLHKYNAFPVDVPEYDWMMMKASEETFRAEVWELYADLTLGNLWLRLGKQQIAWGEMIGGRILDQINALDQSWNVSFEPEEFELIRIPAWSIRGIYQIKQNVLKFLTDTTIEAFVNPADWYPNFTGDAGAPFWLAKFPPVLKISQDDQKDRRGKPQFGFRLGGMVKNIYFTLNYMSLYSQSSVLKFREFVPGGLGIDAKYPSINIFGASANYAFPQPIGVVVSLEGIWIPDQPYSRAGAALPDIRDQGTGKIAINLSRPTSIIPDSFLSASFATITLQLTQTWVEGDERRILFGGMKVDKDQESLVFQIQQPLWHNTLTPTFQFVYDLDDAYMIKPSIKYQWRNHWYFDVFSTILGGEERRPGRLGGFYWADTTYGRITYQF